MAIKIRILATIRKGGGYNFGSGSKKGGGWGRLAMSYFLTEWWLHSGSFCNITELYIFLCALSGAYVTLQNKKVLKLQQSGMTIIRNRAYLVTLGILNIVQKCDKPATGTS